MDARGSTTFPAVFGAAFLIGLILYVFGLGDAMIYHETMRDAADGTAFAPSVIHARGMNVIALVNLVMSAILAVLVAVKIVQLLLMAANVLACVIPFNPHCPLLSSWQSPYGAFTKTTDRGVSIVNRGLYASESAIARSMPVLGQAKARVAARAYAPMVDEGFVAGMSLVPGDLEKGFGGSFAGDGVQSGRTGGGTRFGLPVEDERYENLCLHAGGDIEGFLFVPLKFLPGANVIVQPILKYVGGMVGKVAKAFPGYFCGGGLGPSGLSSLGGVFADIAKKGVTEVAGTICAQAAKAGGTAASSECRSGVSSALGSIEGGSAIRGTGQTSKRIYAPAMLGSDYYASFAFVSSHHMDDTYIDDRLTVISMNRTPREVVSVDIDRLMRSTQLSKAEFYYDPRAKGPKAADALADEALLNMRWRARLRRYRPPTSDARRLLSGPGLGAFAGSIAGGATSSARTTVGVLLGSAPEELARWADTAVGRSVAERETGGLLH